MKKIALSALALLVGTGAASAADLAARPYTKAPPMAPVAVYNWTGFYIGGNVGYGWGDRNTSITAPDAASAAFFGGALASGALPGSYGTKPEGVIGGGQIGYNWQVNSFVFGLEADFQGSDVKGSSTIATTGIPGFVPITSTASEKLDWFGTARGRIGFTANQVLFYATGGLAYGRVSHSYFTAAPAVGQSAAGASAQNDVGYAVGGGIEWAFSPNWSVKGEYLYMDLGSHDTTALGVTGTPAGATLNVHSRDQFNIARVGLNYKFGGPVVAKY